jgi:RNA polymerase sigma factor (sigma-70 family)
MSAPDHDNEDDLSLLRTNPQLLVVKHQPTIHKIVRYFASRGAFSYHHEDDLVQEITVKLLEKARKMQVDFKGRALVRTYLAAVTRNICLDLMRKQRTALRTEPLHEHPGDPQGDPHSITLLDEEKLRFQAILLQYASTRPKVIFCLKLRFRIPLTSSDLRNLCPQCTKSEIHSLLKTFAIPYEGLTDQELYQHVTPFLNRIEGKTTTNDAVRKWCHTKVSEIITLLNGDPPTANHTEETVSILLEEMVHPNRPL